MYRPTLEVAEKLNINIHGIKLILNCSICNRAWSIWFRDENDLLEHLPTNWHVCSGCKNLKNDKELNENKYGYAPIK